MKSVAFRLVALVLALCSVTAPARASLLDYVGECVPFARAASGIQLHGDAWTWWDGAAGHYARGHRPQAGAVIVFSRTGRLPLGHVAVISRVIDERVVLVTHANWSRTAEGERGHVDQDVTLTDVSAAGDWSAVRVWYRGIDGLGSTIFPISGFIYGQSLEGARTRTAAELTSDDPDYVGALIDAYEHH